MATTDLAQVSKGELAERYQRMKAGIQRFRAKSQEGTQKAVGVLVTGAGGFAAGVLDERVPEVGGLPTSIVAGIGLSALGIMGAAGSQSEHLVNFGAGLLAGAAYGHGKKFANEINI